MEIKYIADQLLNPRKGLHGKIFDGPLCTKLPTSGAFLKEVDPPSDYPLAGCLEAHHAVVVGAFNNALDPVLEKKAFHTYMETFKEAFPT